MTRSEAGKLGGAATLARHGRQHFVAAGKLGGRPSFESWVEAAWNDSRKARAGAARLSNNERGMGREPSSFDIATSAQGGGLPGRG